MGSLPSDGRQFWFARQLRSLKRVWHGVHLTFNPADVAHSPASVHKAGRTSLLAHGCVFLRQWDPCRCNVIMRAVRQLAT